MPKTARKKVDSNIYHIVLQGINKQTIFFDDEDREVFLNRIKLTKEKRDFDCYGFCLMSNHIHLLLREKTVSLGHIFMTMLSSYVLWYNFKYTRVGNLFQDRFRSEGINDDAHLLSAMRYIHQNPIKAGMVKSVEEYVWSSHSAYMSEKDSLVYTKLILGMLNGKEAYSKFVNIDEPMQFIEETNRITITDDALSVKINEIARKKQIYDLLRCNRQEMFDIISTVRQTIKGASIRQIARVTGISVNIVRHIE